VIGNAVNCRWLLLDYTDPRFDLSAEQKREIRRRARRIGIFDRPVFTVGLPLTNEIRQARLRRRSAWSRLGVRLPVALLYGAWLAVVLYLPIAVQQGPAIIMLTAAGIVAATLWVVTCWIGLMLTRSRYRHAMYELGYEICAECGYPLFGLDDSTRCPECGWRKTHRDEPPVIDWTNDDRQVLRRHGYEPCMACGGLLRTDDDACPRCGEPHSVTTSGESAEFHR